MATVEYFVDSVRRDYALTEVDTTIGRADECTLQLRHDPEISRVHCSIQSLVDGSYVLLDAGARNGTYLDGKRLTDSQAPLVDGSQIRIGKTLLTFRDRQIGRTTAIFGEIAGEMEDGKGFKTIMRQIVKKRKGE